MKYNHDYPDLPVVHHLERIASSLKNSPTRYLVLTAETAAGKSTVVPRYLLGHFPGKIAMLEPRRLAAYAIADRIASSLGEKPGNTVGYRMRFDTRVGDATHLELMTEAVLVRMMQEDPFLTGYSLVILDEFHERSVQADLALALLREVMTLRDDLYVLIMSATLDTERLSFQLQAPVVTVPGRQHPVEIRYAPPAPGTPVHLAAASAVRSVLSSAGSSPDHPGSILVFLPGISEIRKTRSALSDIGTVFILHSSVPFEEQKEVLSALPDGDHNHRIILSSSIAETSLTVPGVTCVIDSGLSRVSRFDPRIGMTRLVTEIESGFSAGQRTGRAGRTAPGLCVRLWAEHELRLQESPPEICRCDLIPLVLECALWGVRDAQRLKWLDQPNPGAWNSARDFLTSIGALDVSGAVTATGKSIARLGVHPRIAAAALAGAPELAVRHSGTLESPADQERIRQDLKRRLAEAGISPGRNVPAQTESPELLLAGFPDRLARHQEDGKYRLPSGRTAVLAKTARDTNARFPEWIVATDVDGGEREGLIRFFEVLDSTKAEAWLSGRTESRRTVKLVGQGALNSRKAVLHETELYGKIVIRERFGKPEAGETAKAVCEALQNEGTDILPWNAASRNFFARVCFRLSRTAHADTGTLLVNPEDWIVPFLPPNGILTEEVFLESLRWKFDGQAVDRDVPNHIKLVNGISRPLSWEEITPGKGPEPVLETRIQDLYGCASTPCILGEPVLVRLLSPARRPVQITRDLAGFWKTGWIEVRKEMKGRYPRHNWPENPLAPQLSPQ